MTDIIKNLRDHPADELTGEVRALTEQILKRYDREYFREVVKSGGYPTELKQALGSSGLLGLGVPEELGGSGGGMVEQLAMAETMALHGVTPSIYILGNFTRNLVMKFGTPEQVSAFVEPSLTGDAVFSFALTEAESGTNSFAIQTKATRDGDDWVINGQKAFITNIGIASKALIVARTSESPEGKRTSGFSVFAVDLPADGITMHPMEIDNGEAHIQYMVHLDNVRVPSSSLVGEEGKGFSYMFHALNPERLFVAAMGVGFGIFLIDKAVRYANERAPFGKAIGSYQAVQHPLARAYIELRAARSLMYEAAMSMDAGTENPGLVSAAKYLASEAAGRAFDAALQPHGGFGFDESYDVITHYRMLRLLRVAPVNNDTLLNYVSEKVLGLPPSNR